MEGVRHLDQRDLRYLQIRESPQTLSLVLVGMVHSSDIISKHIASVTKEARHQRMQRPVEYHTWPNGNAPRPSVMQPPAWQLTCNRPFGLSSAVRVTPWSVLRVIANMGDARLTTRHSSLCSLSYHALPCTAMIVYWLLKNTRISSYLYRHEPIEQILLRLSLSCNFLVAPQDRPGILRKQKPWFNLLTRFTINFANLRISFQR